jgi:hypothetical protein
MRYSLDTAIARAKLPISVSTTALANIKIKETHRFGYCDIFITTECARSEYVYLRNRLLAEVEHANR